MTKEFKQQFTLRIAQANKTEMIVILYEMTQAYIDEAKIYFENNQRKEFSDTIYKSRTCIKELMQSLHLEYEPAPTLLQLYVYCNKELIRADVRNQLAPLEHVESVISKLHEAYIELAKQDDSEAVMENAQVVYTGFTYNKNSLSEDVTSTALNRGFRV